MNNAGPESGLLLLEAEPSWWNYGWHFCFAWLLVPLIVAVCKQASLSLRVYDDRVALETGLISKRRVTLAMAEINTVEVSQTFWQRLFGIGDIRMATSGVEGYELSARGLPHPAAIDALINAQRRLWQKGKDGAHAHSDER